MARINTNVMAIMAQQDLGRSSADLSRAMSRLSSGLRINRGGDDPAGLINSETLRSEMASIQKAIDNSQRAVNVVATAEGALEEVSALLINIKQLTVEAANTGAMSPEEIEANQLQVDSAVQSITRIANVTNFAGLNLLDGSLDYNLSGMVTSQLNSVQVHNAQFGSATSLPVDVSILTSARPAELRWSNNGLTSAVTIEVAGPLGVETLKFASGANVGTIRDALNGVKDATGVSATWITDAANSADGLRFIASEYGSDSFVSVKALPGTGTFPIPIDALDSASKNRSIGQDVVATVNGTMTVGRGLQISLNSTYLSMDMTIDPGLGSTSTGFTIVGGGAMFQLGPHVSINEQRSMGIPSMAASRLGSQQLGWLSQIVTGGEWSLVAGKPARAAKIVDIAIKQVSSLRGRLGALEKDTLQTNMNSLGVALENITASESSIRDADFAKETAALTRAQILNSAGTSVLQIANNNPQQVLQLLS